MKDLSRLINIPPFRVKQSELTYFKTVLTKVVFKSQPKDCKNIKIIYTKSTLCFRYKCETQISINEFSALNFSFGRT